MSGDDDTLVRCRDCRRRFASENAVKTHRLATHDNPEWVAAKDVKRAAMRRRPIPICPRCGKPAVIQETQFGPRAKCCGLHSWGYLPLVDKEAKADVG